MANEKRLIDAKRLRYELDIALMENYGKRRVGISDSIEIVAMMPTVDAVEVVHGHWEKYTDDKFMGYGADGRIRYRKVYSYKCSKCWNYTAVKHKYCPNCGAKMDGERRTE
jgi:hypothetical protein